MTRKGMWLALAVVLAANGVALAGVAYNRSGAPDARLVLTARELPVSWGFNGPGGSSENSGLALRIDWTPSPEAEKRILTRDKLASLGFALPSEQQWLDWAHRKNPLDRMAYGVFEFEGEAWQQVLKSKQAELARDSAKANTDTQRKNVQQSFDYFERTSSRLVLVDIGADPAQLRAAHADRSKYLIAKLKLALYTYQYDAQKNEVRANITALLPNEVYVPRRFHDAILEPGQSVPRRWKYHAEEGAGPTYRVTLAYGRRHEPWIESISIEPAR